MEMTAFRFSAKALLLLLAVLLLLPACKEKPKNPVEEYGTGLIKSYEKSKDASDAANLDALRKAIQMYRTEHEEYPKTLKDVELAAGFSVDPGRYNYDPATGAVSLKP